MRMRVILATLAIATANVLFSSSVLAALSLEDRRELYETVNKMCSETKNVGDYLSIQGNLEVGAAILKVLNVQTGAEITKKQWDGINQVYSEWRLDRANCSERILKILIPLYGEIIPSVKWQAKDVAAHADGEDTSGRVTVCIRAGSGMMLVPSSAHFADISLECGNDTSECCREIPPPSAIPNTEAKVCGDFWLRNIGGLAGTCHGTLYVMAVTSDDADFRPASAPLFCDSPGQRTPCVQCPWNSVDPSRGGGKAAAAVSGTMAGRRCQSPSAKTARPTTMPSSSRTVRRWRFRRHCVKLRTAGGERVALSLA